MSQITGSVARTHDPRQVAEDIRSHLAAHDKRIGFLFGAGTSCSVNISTPPKAGEKGKHVSLIPNVEELTSVCSEAVSALGESQAKAWNHLLAQCKRDNHVTNVEDVLTRVRVKIEAMVEGDSLIGLNLQQLKTLEKTICETIARAVNPDNEKFPSKLPHTDFAEWIRNVRRTVALEIFTTNYDMLFERAFEDSRVPMFDGFVGSYEPFFYPECLEDKELLPNSRWARLWKLHGSINWTSREHHGARRIQRCRPSNSGEMILPSLRKYDESRKQPYMAYMDRLARTINSNNSLMFTCGYSFGDQHINEILFNALDSRDTANIICLQFNDVQEDDAIVGEARSRQNLTVIGPNAGVISGVFGGWQLTQSVDKKTHGFMDFAFDSNASPADETSASGTSSALTGRMRLGDFNWFTRFLNAMGEEL